MLVLKGRKGLTVTSLVFSPDGKTLAAGMTSRLDLWDVAARTVDDWDTWIFGAPPDSVRFAPSGRRVLMGFGFDRGLRIIDFRPWDFKQVGTFDVNFLAVSTSGQVLVGSELHIGAFGLTKKGLGARKWTKPLNGRSLLAGLDFYPDGKQFATVETQHVKGTVNDLQAVVRVRAAKNGQVKQEAVSDGERGGILRVSPDGEWIAFGAPKPKALIVHHGVELTRIVKIPIKKKIIGLAFHPSGRYLATTNGDTMVRFHDRDANWAVTRTFDWKIGTLKSVAFSPDDNVAAAGGAKGQIVLWDVDV